MMLNQCAISEEGKEGADEEVMDEEDNWNTCLSVLDGQNYFNLILDTWPFRHLNLGTSEFDHLGT